MTKKQIEFAKTQNFLKLFGWRKFTHYEIVFYILIIPLLIIFLKVFKWQSFSLSSKEIVLLLFLGTICYLLFLLQKSRLKFKSVNVTLEKEKTIEIIKIVAKKLKWIPVEITEEYIVAKTFPSFFSGSWGEEITIIFDKNRILINSICDPDKKSSIISMGRNRKNINTLIKELNHYQKQ